MTDTTLLESAKFFSDGFFSYGKDKIRNAGFLRQLLDYCFATQTVEKLHEISFTAKYIIGLHKILLGTNRNPEITDNHTIEKDLSLNLQKFIDEMKLLLINERSSLPEEFSQMSAMTSESFEKLYSLIADLDLLKQYFNILMRESDKQDRL